MHHVTLAAAGQSDDRQSVLHPACAKPELLQVWHLDTTKLKDLQTHKYRPDFTERFGTAEDARADYQHFFLLVHRHPLIRHRLHDPTENVHYDRAQTLFCGYYA